MYKLAHYTCIKKSLKETYMDTLERNLIHGRYLDATLFKIQKKFLCMTSTNKTITCDGIQI